MQFIKLNSLADWATLEKGKAILFEGGLPNVQRSVSILFNFESVTTMYIEPEDENEPARMLCTAGPGLVRIDFDAVGVFGIFAEEAAGEVQYQSAELVDVTIDDVDQENFTEIMERRAIDPAYEAMWHLANRNIEQRFAFLQQQHEMKLAEMEVRNAPVATPPANSAGSVSQPSGQPSAAQAPGGDNAG